ncbi:branched-chain amino acid ABC transporter permease [Marinobacter subterrani]|uniref:Amino acid/amide ABC transporter membrane protein 2, HAAT family n=1 Tax=Marinobacter subterrani TaxID=1658765 RepID=A0A0J7LWB7_9GAMM|nr:branched-chain amino acid ABC transporter permease [Marinobacter subterrani]KMQ73180.1 amino acid/amide ABC transporter membrane protein 2, HAAT family [Marinobacter subterrani]
MASKPVQTPKFIVRALLIGAIAIALAVLPAFIDPYTLRIATGALMWAGLACAWNIVGGYAGYISFGHSAFFGIGAYTTAILMQSDIGASFFATLIPAIILSMAVAVVIGGPTMRLRGAYFAIATWAFAEMLLQLTTVLDFTGGTAGLSLPAYLNEFFFYYTMLIAAVVSFAGVWLLIERSRFGFRIKALRDDEPAAQSLGIRTNLVKVQSFALSAAITALFGSIYAYWTTYIDPHSVMGPDITDQMVVMVLLGGLGTVWGPALGAVLLWITNRYIWSTFGDTVIYLPILGIIIALVVLFLPNGLISLIVGPQRGKELMSSILRKF